MDSRRRQVIRGVAAKCVLEVFPPTSTVREAQEAADILLNTLIASIDKVENEQSGPSLAVVKDDEPE